MFRKPIKMRNLEAWGVPSYIVDIWEKNCSPYLLTVQEEAVREYGVLDFNGRRKKKDSRFHGNDIKRNGSNINGSGNDSSEVRLHRAGLSAGKGREKFFIPFPQF